MQEARVYNIILEYNIDAIELNNVYQHLFSRTTLVRFFAVLYANIMRVCLRGYTKDDINALWRSIIPVHLDVLHDDNVSLTDVVNHLSSSQLWSTYVVFAYNMSHGIEEIDLQRMYYIIKTLNILK